MNTHTPDLWELVEPTLLDDQVIPEWALVIATRVDEEGDYCYGYRIVEATAMPPIESVTQVMHHVIADVLEIEEVA